MFMDRDASFDHCPSGLDGLYVFRCRALRTLLDFEADALALGQRLEANGLNGAVMNEHITAFVILDEPETLLLIEPLHFAF
jgi:hypothetical protein